MNMPALGKTVLRGLLATYLLVVTLMILSVSGDQRKAFVNNLAEQLAHHIHPRAVMIGDSLTANGTPWGWKLYRRPLSVVTKARSGYTVKQISEITDPEKWGYTPEVAVLTAGMNDAFNPYSNPERFAADYKTLVRATKVCRCHVIITLIPPTRNLKRNLKIKLYNRIIEQIAIREDIKTINLWKDLSDGYVIRPEFTVDGIHFTEPAYDIWVKRLKESLGQ